MLLKLWSWLRQTTSRKCKLHEFKCQNTRYEGSLGRCQASDCPHLRLDVNGKADRDWEWLDSKFNRKR